MDAQGALRGVSMDQSLIFLTGMGTLGREILVALLERTPHRVAVLVRPRARRSAMERAARLFAELGLTAEQQARIEVVAGDITRHGLGLDPETQERLVRSTAVIIHTAAVTSLVADRALCQAVNIDGTANLLIFAERALALGPLRKVVHLSTAFVAGARCGHIEEDCLPPTPQHFNHYEWSKYEAERLVRAALGTGLPATILRPSMVVGDTATGRTRDFNVIYPLLRLMASGLVTRFPACPRGRVHLAPIDFVIEATLRAAQMDWTTGHTFHLTSPKPPTVEQLLACDEFFPDDAPRPRLLPPAQLDLRECRERERELLMSVAFCFPYFNAHMRFATTNTARLVALPTTDAEYLARLGRYAVESGYLRRLAA
ncbi:MAG: hypothetical protein C4334_07880 [Pyrinomonas sp.]